MPRIKVTGYLPTEDMDEDHVDLGHESGLSENGDMAVRTYDGPGASYKTADLEDLEIELEQ